MNMRFGTGGTRAGLLLLVLTSCPPLFAGALMPCLKAAASKNGDSLVVVERQPGSGQISLQVFPKENWVNAKDKLNAPTVSWTDFMRWSIVLEPQRLNWDSCPLPLITDDGEFLILLNRDPSMADREALQIYRRRDRIGDPIREGPDHGVFIKSILFKEILPPNGIGANQVWTDESPQWFVGSSFDFSVDNRELLYKLSRGDAIHIDLHNGSVRRN
jgi:hypothetical protein